MAVLNANELSTYAVSNVEAMQTIVIPIANPDTAQPLLSLAENLVKVNDGRIVLLYVAADYRELEAAKIAAFQRITEDAYQDHHRLPVELKICHSPSVVDSILEVADELDADMILLGLSYSIRGQVELGRIVESVAHRAKCDVGVYRSPMNAFVSRVVIPVGGSVASRVILKIGIRLSEAYRLPCEALHVYNNSSEREARYFVQDLLETVPGHEKVNVNVEHGFNEANSVLSWTNENDLMVVGFSERSRLEKWLYGDTAQRILDRARGPVLVVSRAIDNVEIQALARRRLSWLRPLLTRTEQEHIIWLAKDTVLPTLDYTVLLIVAALLASLGLLLNSSAVVIGAMLVAPLMQPIIALGIGLCTARLNLMRKAAVTIILSTLIVLAVGFLAGLLTTPASPTNEILSRAYPSLLDAGVALGAGFIGAYATARKDIPAALAGVAIAAALVPPICAVGLSLALTQYRLAIGAGMLFMTNLVCITIVAAVVFFWMGMRPTRLDSSMRRRRYVLLLAGILCMMFVVGGMLNYTNQPTVERISETRLQTVFDPAELVNIHIQRQDPMLVVATVRTATDLSPETVKMAQVALSEDLDTPVRLRIVVQRVIDGM